MIQFAAIAGSSGSGSAHPPPNACANPPGSLDHVDGDLGAALRGQRRVDPGGRGHPDLHRLPVGAERGAHPARLEQGEALRRDQGRGVEPEQASRRGGRPGGAAHRGRVPAAVVERRVAGPAQGAHRLEPGGVGGEDIAHARAPRGPHGDRRRRGGRAEVREARQVGVVEVEHVAGRPQPRDALEQAVARRPRRAGGALLAPGGRAGHPVDQGGAVGVAHDGHGLRASVARYLRMAFGPMSSCVSRPLRLISRQ